MSCIGLCQTIECSSQVSSYRGRKAQARDRQEGKVEERDIFLFSETFNFSIIYCGDYSVDVSVDCVVTVSIDCCVVTAGAITWLSYFESESQQSNTQKHEPDYLTMFFLFIPNATAD